jgi:serine/threonine protein kinase
MLGTTLRNRYKIVQVLGSGGFGDTYLAEDMDLPGKPKCVVKQLRLKDTNPAVQPIARSLFEREAEYLYRIGNAHPQIPDLFAYFTENGEFFLVEEFVDGHSLIEEFPSGTKLTESQVLGLTLEILEILAFVHQQQVIHRDIKLANLMRRRRDGKIMLIDFGAVKDVSVLGTDNQGQTNVTVSIGSPGYMPSEQAKGKPRLSSDVYAVGMIAIQLLTGISPDHLAEDPDTGEVVWQQYAPTVSSNFADILHVMVRYDFRQRYPNAGEALKALSAIANPEAIAPTQAINSLNAVSSTVVSPSNINANLNPHPSANLNPAVNPTNQRPSMTPPTVITPSVEPTPITQSQSNKPTFSQPPTPQVATPPAATVKSGQNPWVIVASALAAAVGAAVITIAKLPNRTANSPAPKVVSEKSADKVVENPSDTSPADQEPEASNNPQEVAKERATPPRTIPKNSTPSPTRNANSSAFIPVDITSTYRYRHRSGLFSINIPTGWQLQDGSKSGEVIQLWFDPSKNALIGVDIFSAPPGMANNQLVVTLQTFLRNTFGSKPGFFMREPIAQPDGSSLIVWGFKEQIQGIEGEILGNSFIEQKGDKVSVLTTGVLSDQYERLKPEYEKIVNSYRVNPAVPLP